MAFIIGDAVNTAQTMPLPTTGAGPLTTVMRYTDPLGLTRAANATATANNPYAAATAATAGIGSNAANPPGFGAVNGYISGLDDTASTLTHLGARDHGANACVVLGINTVAAQRYAWTKQAANLRQAVLK